MRLIFDQSQRDRSLRRSQGNDSSIQLHSQWLLGDLAVDTMTIASRIRVPLSDYPTGRGYRDYHRDLMVGAAIQDAAHESLMRRLRRS